MLYFALYSFKIVLTSWQLFYIPHLKQKHSIHGVLQLIYCRFRGPLISRFTSQFDVVVNIPEIDTETHNISLTWYGTRSKFVLKNRRWKVTNFKWNWEVGFKIHFRVIYNRSTRVKMKLKAKKGKGLRQNLCWICEDFPLMFKYYSKIN